MLDDVAVRKEVQDDENDAPSLENADEKSHPAACPCKYIQAAITHK